MSHFPILKCCSTHYRLGKNLPFSGNLSRYSLSALTFHIIAVMPSTTAPMIAVFAFQFEGCVYQPPDGDQTCLGYLCSLLGAACIPTRLEFELPGGELFEPLTYGTFGPPPWKLLAYNLD